MPGIEITNTGNYEKTRAFLKNMTNANLFSDLDRYGQMGVNALSSATPVDTGLTAQSWGYRIINDLYGPGIEWYNTDVENGVNVAILIQYGHGTGTGGYVQGRDFINPTMHPIFDQIANDIWKKVNP